MPDIKRRDKRQNNGTSFNKPEYGIGRPVGFNQVPGSSSLRLLGAFAHSSHIHAQVDELNSPTTGDDELSLLLSHLLLPLPLSTLTARIGRSSLRRRARITTESFIILSFDVGRKKINSLGYRIFLFQYSLSYNNRLNKDERRSVRCFIEKANIPGSRSVSDQGDNCLYRTIRSVFIKVMPDLVLLFP